MKSVSSDRMAMFECSAWSRFGDTSRVHSETLPFKRDSTFRKLIGIQHKMDSIKSGHWNPCTDVISFSNQLDCTLSLINMNQTSNNPKLYHLNCYLIPLWAPFIWYATIVQWKRHFPLHVHCSNTMTLLNSNHRETRWFCHLLEYFRFSRFSVNSFGFREEK